MVTQAAASQVGIVSLLQSIRCSLHVIRIAHDRSVTMMEEVSHLTILQAVGGASEDPQNVSWISWATTVYQPVHYDSAFQQFQPEKEACARSSRPDQLFRVAGIAPYIDLQDHLLVPCDDVVDQLIVRLSCQQVSGVVSAGTLSHGCDNEGLGSVERMSVFSHCVAHSFEENESFCPMEIPYSTHRVVTVVVVLKTQLDKKKDHNEEALSQSTT